MTIDGITEIPTLTEIIIKGDEMMAGKFEDMDQHIEINPELDSSSEINLDELSGLIDAAIDSALPEIKSALKQKLLSELHSN